MENELTPKISETIDFFQKSTKWIIFGVILGVSFSLIYLLLAQPSYLATSSIRLSDLKRASDLEFSFDVLVQKIREPSSYRVDANEACLSIRDFREFNKNLIITQDPASLSRIDLSYSSSQPKEASTCLEKVILVVDEIYKESVSKTLRVKEREIINLQGKVGAIKSEILVDADSQVKAVVNWLIVREQLNQTRSQVLQLETEINDLKKSAEYGVKPSKISLEANGPKRKVIFLNGLFSGVIFGLLVQLFLGVKLCRKKL